MTHGRLPGISPAALSRKGEHGFTFIVVIIGILAIATSLTTLSYVARRNLSYDLNYAAGERLADTALMAHNFAQYNFYTDSNNLDGSPNLFTAAGAMEPPFAFHKILNTEVSMDVRGINEAPPFGVSNKAASAYLHMKIRPPAGLARVPTDEVALLAGAASRKMNRVGIVGRIPAADICGGEATRVRWGPEGTSCLNQTQLDALGFADVEDGDIVVPAWESALDRMDQRALMRFPQPLRPDKNAIIMPALAMGNNSVLEAGNVLTANVTATGNTIVRGNLQARQGTTTNMNDDVTTEDSLAIANPTNPSLIVEGPVTLSGGDITVAENLQKSTNAGSSLTVISENPVEVRRVGVVNGDEAAHESIDVTLTRIGATGSTLVAVDNVTGNVADLASGTDLNVSGTMDTTLTDIVPATDHMEAYAAHINVEDGPAAGPGGKIDGTSWEINSVDQIADGTANTYLKVPSFYLNAGKDCLGKACPDNVVTNPPDQPF